MTNYEHYKEQIERIARLGRSIAMKVTTYEIVCCGDIGCDECLFRGSEDANCFQKAFKWADEEYKESEVDWSKVPVDTAVLISVDNKNWFNRYFAGVNEKGQPTVFCYGATQWSNGYEEPCHFKYIKLAEVE